MGLSTYLTSTRDLSRSMSALLVPVVVHTSRRKLFDHRNTKICQHLQIIPIGIPTFPLTRQETPISANLHPLTVVHHPSNPSPVITIPLPHFSAASIPRPPHPTSYHHPKSLLYPFYTAVQRSQAYPVANHHLYPQRVKKPMRFTYGTHMRNWK